MKSEMSAVLGVNLKALRGPTTHDGDLVGPPSTLHVICKENLSFVSNIIIFRGQRWLTALYSSWRLTIFSTLHQKWCPADLPV